MIMTTVMLIMESLFMNLDTALVIVLLVGRVIHLVCKMQNMAERDGVIIML